MSARRGLGLALAVTVIVLVAAWARAHWRGQRALDLGNHALAQGDLPAAGTAPAKGTLIVPSGITICSGKVVTRDVLIPTRGSTTVEPNRVAGGASHTDTSITSPDPTRYSKAGRSGNTSRKRVAFSCASTRAATPWSRSTTWT